ncbi:DUF5686 family protein [Bacteroidaceae bacterium]|uniref:DUF5686 and carboxypeptidase-like regulatory domain-containing protein n=1 Tax=Phocaeicola faecicola TaxID=2739389 RepID=UPI0015B6B448
MVKRLLLLMFWGMWTICTFAQIHGTVVDSETGDPIPYLNIYYDGKGMGTITDMEGRYSIEYHSGWNELTFSMVGYTTQVIKVSAQTRELNIKMRSDLMLEEVIVKPKKEKYSRKNNPAVELMKKVIASKKKTNLEQNDFYRYNKYQKITLAVNNITADSLRESWLFKKYPFFRDQVEVCDVTNKNILPLSIDETVSEKVYRKEPHSEKTYIRGINSGGVNELFSTGDMLTTVLKDVFQDIDIYQDRFRFLQYPFDSPVSEAGINFYKFYIMDTVYVDKEKCFHLSFVPNNPQDFGFTGHLYILADSTYRVKESQLNLPKKTDINFVDNMIIDQKFGELPTGEWVLLEDDMLCELSYLKKVLGSYQVRRTTRYFDFSFDPIPESMFKRKEKEIKDVNAMMRNEMYWSQYRQEELTKSETRMGSFVDDLTKIKGFKYIIFVLKALIENFVETSTPDSKVDIGPINTIISSNYIDGLRLRGSLQTTAKLHPHLFLKGYYAYGFKDQKSKYMGEVEYSFNKKEYLPREYPKNSLTLTYQYDNMLPSDKFISTDKDNVFTALKVCSVDQYNYERKATLKYEREREFGLKTTAMFRHANYEPCGELFYRTMAGESALQSALDRQELAGQKWVKSPFNTHDITVTEMSFGLRYAPGETFVNTKQRRLPVNLDAPEFTLQHTLALKGVLGGDYTYNMTEASAYKRFWLSSWGNIDVYLKGGIQWNKVPFPLLIMPAANLSYIIQDETFNLINNMEFLNDRYASLDVSWNMQGKLFNRIPLLKKLKWREFIGVKCLWGTLTDKNNPFLEQNRYDNTLMMFPGHYDMNGVYQYSSNVMDPKKPYVEITAGIHNIFKLLHVEYVRRLNYNELPTANKWGVRLMIRTVF